MPYIVFGNINLRINPLSFTVSDYRNLPLLKFRVFLHPTRRVERYFKFFDLCMILSQFKMASKRKFLEKP